VKGRAAFLIGLALLLAGCSLAGDVTPLPGAEARPLLGATPTLTAEEVLGVVRASAEVGAKIYAERCVACHGPAGDGDGEQAAQLPNPPAKFSDAAVARAASPQRWFDIITNGRLENFMPPFGQSTTVAERWHLVAFLYTLSTPADEMELGERVFTQQCAECHTAASQPDFSQLNWQAARSPNDLFAALARPEHDFENLPESERWAAVSYVRNLALEYAAPGGPPLERLGAVVGRVTNGTAGAGLPANLEAQLVGADETGIVLTRTTILKSDGSFEFAAVPYTLQQQFAVTTNYNGVAYFSHPARFEVGADRLDASFSLYEATSAPDTLRVRRLETYILFQTPGQATVGQLFTFSNTGDRTFIPTERNAVTIRLPAGAQNVSVPDGVEGQTYLRVNETVADLRPVPPGEDTLEVLVSYQLPFTGKLAFSQPQAFPVDEALLLVGDATASVSGAAWQAAGTQWVQNEAFQSFRRLALSAHETLAFDVTSANSWQNVLLGGGVFVLAAFGIGWAWWRIQRGSAVENHRERLLAELARLDDALAAGQLEPAQHQRQRAKLKAELTKIWLK